MFQIIAHVQAAVTGVAAYAVAHPVATTIAIAVEAVAAVAIVVAAVRRAEG